jgi:hypothetical protein
MLCRIGASQQGSPAVPKGRLFEFLDYGTGQLDPSYDSIAAKAGVCRRVGAAASSGRIGP